MELDRRVNAAVLSDDPLVIVVQNNLRSPYIGDLDVILPHIGERHCHAFVVPASSILKRGDRNERERVDAFRSCMAQHPKAQVSAFCNEEAELSVFRGSGIAATVLNQNAFVDERLFFSEPVSPIYDAIYTGQMKPFKRHFLAAEIRKLALIYYGSRADLSYFELVKTQLPHAALLNGDPVREGLNPFRFFDAKNVRRLYSSSKVGLALSQFEGAMYASVEYLLCGLPVVSSANLGGRDYFASPEYWSVPEDTPESVSACVEEMIARNIEPGYIRKKTVERMQKERNKLFALVDEIYRGHGHTNRSFAQEFSNIFADKLWKTCAILGTVISPCKRAET
jgi:glycosyltransferase involved in cell wall biosynthesis